MVYNSQNWCIHMTVGLTDIYLTLMELKYYEGYVDERSLLL